MAESQKIARAIHEEQGGYPRALRTADDCHVDSDEPLSFENGPAEAGQETKHRAFNVVSLDNLRFGTAEPEYVIDAILPRRHVTLLGAHGGAGKSILGLTWAAHVAAGCNWAGLAVYQGKVLYVSLEDGADLLRHRLKCVMEVCGLNYYSNCNLTILDGSHSDGNLVIEQSEGGVRRVALTPAFAELSVLTKGYDLVIIDNASDAYGGNENERRQVRSFIRILAQLARENNASVLLLAHIDKAGARYATNKNSYAGSTAWHNSSRSRLALLQDSEGHIVLHHEKANLGPRIEPVALIQDGPVLVPMPRDRLAESIADEKQANEDAETVLNVIRIAIESGDDVTTATAGPNTTFHALAAYPELPKTMHSKDGRRRFWRAVKLLQRQKRIRKSPYKNTARKTKERFEVEQSASVEG